MGLERVGVAALLGEEYRLLHDAALRFLRERRAIAPEANPASAQAITREMARFGWLDVFANDAGATYAAAIVEAAGRAGVLVPFVAAVVAGVLLRAAGVRDVLDDLAAGRVLVVPAIESAFPNAVALDRNGRASGRLHAVEHVLAADTVLCPVDDGQHLALVEIRTGGSRLVPVPSAGGEYRGDVVLEDAVARLLPLPREALAHARLMGAVLRATELAGIGRAGLDLAIEYARRRVQFGRPIGSFQAVHHHAADMTRELVAVCLLAASAVQRLEKGENAAIAAHMAKAKAAAAIPVLLRLAHQITGGAGFYEEYPLAGYYRRAIDLAASYGTAAEHRRTLAELARMHPAALRHGGGHPFPPVIAL